jgi:hypothetical protein
MAQQWRYPLTPVSGVAGVPVTAAALTSGFTGTAATYAGQSLPQLPPLDRPGGRLIIEAQLEYTTIAAFSGTVTLAVYAGASGLAIGSKVNPGLVVASGPLSLPASATAWPVYFYFACRFRALGGGTPTPASAVGVSYGQGWVKWANTISAFTVAPVPVTAAARTVSTWNTSNVNELDFGITPSTVTDFTNVTMTDFSAEYSG